MPDAIIQPQPFSSLTIGSVPFTGPAEALESLVSVDIPAYPQLVQLGLEEDMLFGALDGLYFVRGAAEEQRITVPAAGLEENLARFYESFYAADFSFLAPGPKSSRGLAPFLEKAEKDPAFGRHHLKAQVAGPLTLGQSVRTEAGRLALDEPDLLEALALGLGGKAAYLGRLIRQTGRGAVVFVDEPGLTGYGSAFSSLSEETVLKTLETSLEAAQSQGPVLLGCHVCGNTDWGLLARTRMDILNFDAFNYLEPFCLYPRELAAFLEKGGWIAYGLVPTEDYTPDLTAAGLLDHLARGLETLVKHGISRELLSRRALFSSSCGLGQLAPDRARAILQLLAEVSSLARSRGIF
ncbi:MAG: hypothetical protein LBK52_04910 [Deltaproteobacteria bacterium]|jgi:hypothetical protein|nr:hypothetical protein [Deltaproteobacteria bacterium]